MYMCDKVEAFNKIDGLEIMWMDVELVHSVNQLGQCSKFKKVNELLKGEKSVQNRYIC
jgi:hypothetical protein